MVAAVLSPPSLNRSDSFHLLCACATANPSPGQVIRIEQAGASIRDWTSFISLADHHGVLPLVVRNLVNYGRDLPTETVHLLQSTYEANLPRSLWFASELSRVQKHLEERHVPVIAYKGPVLAESAYGDIGLRSFSDLDLLISPSDFTCAKIALTELGYRPSQELPPAVEQFFLRTGYERSFDSEAGKNLLELQWSLLPRFYAVDFASAQFAFNHLFTRSRAVEICGRSIRGLSPEDSLLALSIHAAKHLWTRLIWIADIAQTLHSQPIDISVVMIRARALGIRRILGVSLWLSNRLLGTTVPIEARSLIEEDSEVQKYGEHCISRISRAATYDFDSTAYFTEVARLRERRTDRWRYLWRLVWIPGPGDLAAVQLPQALFPLYHSIRAARLLRKLA